VEGGAVELSVDEWQLRVLRLMREATAAGVIRWVRSPTDPDWFSTTPGPIQSFIRFKWPSYNGDTSSDRDFVEVDGAGRFMIGTPGWVLALEILGAGLDDWREHVAALRRQYAEQARLLADAIQKKQAEPGAAADGGGR
jgi:hypothetical protein